MTKGHWQAVAAFAGGLALVASAAAWNTGRALEVAHAELRAMKPAPVQYVQRQSAPRAFVPEQRSRPARATAAPGDRCISGQHFRKVGNEWQQLGHC